MSHLQVDILLSHRNQCCIIHFAYTNHFKIKYTFSLSKQKKTINFAHIIQTHTNTYTHTTSTDMNGDRVVDLYGLLQTWRINLKNLIICTYSDKFFIRIAINVHWDPHLFHPKTDNILKPTHTNKLHTYIYICDSTKTVQCFCTW